MILAVSLWHKISGLTILHTCVVLKRQNSGKRFKVNGRTRTISENSVEVSGNSVWLITNDSLTVNYRIKDKKDVHFDEGPTDFLALPKQNISRLKVNHTAGKWFLFSSYGTCSNSESVSNQAIWEKFLVSLVPFLVSVTSLWDSILPLKSTSKRAIR